MWWAGSNPLDAYLGTRSTAICRGSERVWSAACSGVDDGLQKLRSQLQSNTARQRIRLWLSGGLCRPFLIQAVAGVRNTAEAQRIADATAPNATGLQGACRVWIESRQPSGARVAVAAVADVLNAASELATGGRGRVMSVKPWWSEVLRAAMLQSPPPTALSLQDCDSVTILLGQGGQFDVATTVAPVQDAESARTAFARAALSSSVDVGDPLTVVLNPLRELPAVQSDERMALGALAEVSR